MADFTSIDKATKMLNTSVDHPDVNANLTEEQLAAVDITSPLNLTLSFVKPILPKLPSLADLKGMVTGTVDLPPMPFSLSSLPSITSLSSIPTPASLLSSLGINVPSASSLMSSLGITAPTIPVLNLNFVKSLMSVALKIPKMIDIPELPQLPRKIFDVGVSIPKLALAEFLPDTPPNPLAAMKTKVTGLVSGAAVPPELANLKKDVQLENKISKNVAPTPSVVVATPSVATNVSSVPAVDKSAQGALVPSEIEVQTDECEDKKIQIKKGLKNLDDQLYRSNNGAKIAMIARPYRDESFGGDSTTQILTSSSVQVWEGGVGGGGNLWRAGNLEFTPSVQDLPADIAKVYNEGPLVGLLLWRFAVQRAYKDIYNLKCEELSVFEEPASAAYLLQVQTLILKMLSQSPRGLVKRVALEDKGAIIQYLKDIVPIWKELTRLANKIPAKYWI